MKSRFFVMVLLMIFVANRLRPVDLILRSEHAGEFPSLKIFNVEGVIGRWHQAEAKHVADGGTFDRVIAAVTKRP